MIKEKILKKIVFILILLLAAADLASSAGQAAEAEKYWPQWRGIPEKDMPHLLYGRNRSSFRRRYP